ncbi:MAG TPA: TIGR03619 family F420-dependent LLM class oxidoreductase [Acidimicrobiales bacterium]|nr:TIGR03619 family F420-dependent LLM class oxidoreductase [Acidimicrobiales bacterium]
MRFGIHLPQFGRAAVTGGIGRAARTAEQLGFVDVWVSDHLVIPKDQSYPSPYLYDPLVSLSFAAAATSMIDLGTSVLVGPQYTSPLALANTLSSLDNLSGGRLTVGLGIGWSKPEYEALHAPFDHRGARLDEIIDLFHTAWHDDPATHVGRYYAFQGIRLQPKPAHEIPIWLGGTSDAAYERAARRADGYHGIGVQPQDAKSVVERIRATRPEDTFTISLRVGWDASRVSPDDMKAQRDTYEAAGIQHIVVAPERGDIDTWLAGMETIAGALSLGPR